MTKIDQGIKIRNARTEELDAILNMSLEAYEEFGTRMPVVNWRGLRATLIRTLKNPGNAEIIVAEMDGNLVGSVLLFPGNSDAYGKGEGGAGWPELRLLAVPPAARGRGIGTLLMEECIKRAREAGASALGLHTGDSMVVALPMYERRGFARHPESDFEVPDGELVKGYVLDLKQ